jgi:hypothetical protein
MANNQYSVLYDVSLVLNIKGKTLTIPTENIISISILNHYDTATFPICRFRLECDLSTIQSILDYPDEIEIRCNLDANVYQMTDNDNKLNVVDGAKNIYLSLKGYVENKNIPTNVMDQYDNGIPRTDDLNVNKKVPFEIYGYHSDFIYGLKRSSEAVYHNITLQDVMEDMLRRQNIHQTSIQIVENQQRFDQILIPNLNIIQTIAYFDQYYGLYQTGGFIYGDIDNKLYIGTTSTAVNTGNMFGIRVEDYRSDSDMGGLKKYGDGSYTQCVMSMNVSVLTESDIERILNADTINAVNVNTEDIQSASLKELYTNASPNGKEPNPNIIHKHINPFVASTSAARVKERITQVDLSCNGCDIGNLHADTRINLIFDTAIRGRNMSGLYRMGYANHFITQLDGSLFTSTSTFRLHKNN